MSIPFGPEGNNWNGLQQPAIPILQLSSPPFVTAENIKIIYITPTCHYAYFVGQIPLI